MWCGPTIRGSATAMPRSRHQEMNGAVSISLRNEAKQRMVAAVRDGRQGGEAGAQRRAAGAALLARHRVAPLEHEIAQRALGRRRRRRQARLR